MVRWVVALGAAATAFLIAPASANHIPGATYNGTVSGGGTVSLVVSPDGTQVDFSSANWSGGGCGTSSADHSDLPITNHSFFYTDEPSNGATISGSFPTPGTASGTVRVKLACDTGNVSWTAETPVTWADATIRRSGSDSPRGNDVYNTTGADQTRKWSAKRGHSRKFVIGLQNDGTEQGKVKVDGCGNSKGFRVTYLDGTHNVTDKVVPGDYKRNLGPDEHASLGLKIKVGRHARVGKTKTCAVKASTGADTDVVKAKLKVKSG